MDPVTALGVATATFNTLKKGFAIGKDAHSMMNDVGKWMSAIENIKKPQKKKVKKVANVEQEALEQYGAKKKAEQMERELKLFLQGSYGMDAWDDLMRIQGQIRKQRRMQEEYEKKQREDMINAIILGVGVLIGGGVLVWILLLTTT
jgi:hypothetical protein